MDQLDILAFGAHPDDVEIGMAATLAKYASSGYRVGICNLTKAELSSNGTVELRQAEADQAAAELGISVRIQLDLPDRGLFLLQPEDLAKVTAVIRRYQPSHVFSPSGPDRHPDHIHAGNIIREAVFNAGIFKYSCGEDNPSHKVKGVYSYFINDVGQPDFVIDTTEWIEVKRKTLAAYKSQFVPSSYSVETPLTADYIERVMARDKLFGSEVGVGSAEGFKTMKPLVISNLMEGTMS
ncbi:bacillithiol biosynthesis deacetylase BshB1 [Alkalicoccobacillus porphyridii]|uniref:Bacillithiol biosynthesis deacetylase BshB1 n=1 Tax=Alkalicoccobacillus porphyridii TaxID=2597270 RepID=A0A553ZZR6_9BACI|nr:bacillithiol biosynthesis deacetylase BshB1 [Alkalicoccobacillus porphyridii]TSB46937.1 bacillithiol biosynthesis deacetylase BshB1 [Alkalicoccobacillus porphyridii]